MLLDRLKDEIFESDADLATAIREVLDSVSQGQTLFGRIKQGGLGAQAYRRARFLKTAGDTYVINWVRTFINEFYPAMLSKRGDNFALVNNKRLSLILESIRCWLSRRVDGELPRLTRLFDDVDPQAEKKEKARGLRKAGATLQTIMTVLDEGYGTVQDWCKDIMVEKETVRGNASKKRAKKNAEDVQLKSRALPLKEKGLALTQIATELKISRRKLSRILES